MREVASGKIFSCLYAGINSYSLIKLTRSNLFRLYFIEKNNWRGAHGKIVERGD